MDYKKEIDDLISVMINENGSDIHLTVGISPTVRISGILIPLIKKGPLTEKDIEAFLDILLTHENKKRFIETKEVDFSYSYKNKVRFRGNCFYSKGTIRIVLRMISMNIKTIPELNLPPILEFFAEKNQGFFLVVGPVGQGKTTTLAAMVEFINKGRAEHIITIEDPIEYIYEPKKSIIDQREVRVDTLDFHEALKSVFRQDVDVIMVGEMRNAETMATTVSAAETGHLVLSTLHTNNAAQTIDRIIDSFSADQQDQIREQLSETMTGIFSQRLIPRVSGGLIPAYELLINNSAVGNLIREHRTHEINSVIETGMEQGMIDMNRSLTDLVRKGEITVENAYRHSFNSKNLEKFL